MTAPLLSGLRVLDFSTTLPGPLATLLLVEAGAEVIKIERSGTGDHYRAQLFGGVSTHFDMLNRGKKSVALDLKDTQSRTRVLELSETADIVVEQFRPGVMDRLGLGYEAVKARNPRIIYCSITGFGQRGPNSQHAGHDINFLADAGLLALSCGEPGQRVLPPALIADIAGASYPAFMNILLALLQRQRSGTGCQLDIAMTDNLFTLMSSALAEGFATGTWPGNADRLPTGSSPRYRLYETRDGKMLAVAAIEEKFWAAFTSAIALEPSYCDDSRVPERTITRIQEIIGSRNAADWSALLDPANCCCNIVLTTREAVTLAARRGVFTSNAGGIPPLPLPIASALRSPDTGPRAVPELGQHNQAFGFPQYQAAGAST